MKEEMHKFVNRSSFKAFIENATLEKIFHITRYKHYLSILKDGCIKGGKNPERNWKSSSFFMNSGCVSVINNKKSYRPGMSEADADMYRSKFDFFSANFVSGHYENNAVFLILTDDVESELVSWKLCKAQNKLKETVIPYYEAGYLGDIPLSRIQYAILLDLAIPKSKGLAGILERVAREMRAK